MKKLKTSYELAMAGVNLPQGKTINIDFDGTCVSHEFPEIGRDIGAVPVLRELVETGTFENCKEKVWEGKPNE